MNMQLFVHMRSDEIYVFILVDAAVAVHDESISLKNFDGWVKEYIIKRRAEINSKKKK